MELNFQVYDKMSSNSQIKIIKDVRNDEYEEKM